MINHDSQWCISGQFLFYYECKAGSSVNTSYERIALWAGAWFHTQKLWTSETPFTNHIRGYDGYNFDYQWLRYPSFLQISTVDKEVGVSLVLGMI